MDPAREHEASPTMSSNRIRGKFARIGELPAPRLCLYEKCSQVMMGRRSDARWCSVKCRTYYMRIQRRLERILEHPRCVVCDTPIRYGKPGVNLYQVTCGKRRCRVTRRRWFDEPIATPKCSPERRREIARHAAQVRWLRRAA
jgi:hypothetical protein